MAFAEMATGSPTRWPRALRNSLRRGLLWVHGWPRPRRRWSDAETLARLAALSPQAASVLLAEWRAGMPVPSAAAPGSGAEGLPWEAAVRARGLRPQAEARLLVEVGRNRFGRQQWLAPTPARALQRLLAAATRDGIALELVSGFRSIARQRAIVEAKHQRGQDWAQILAVSAPPGYSEHHSGRAIDLATPGQPLLETDFAQTPAHAWLQTHAGEHGFHLSYPPDNAEGYAWEPWHWCYSGVRVASG